VIDKEISAEWNRKKWHNLSNDSTLGTLSVDLTWVKNVNKWIKFKFAKIVNYNIDDMKIDWFETKLYRLDEMKCDGPFWW